MAPTRKLTKPPAAGKSRIYRGRALAQVAFPLGGIGTGTVSLGGRGQLQDWELFNRPSKGLTLQNTFFAVWAKADGKPARAAVLEADPLPPYDGSYGDIRGPVPGLPRLREAAFSATYPFARVQFSDPDLPVQVKLEAYSPFIPLKDLDSGLPGTVVLVTLTNPGRKRVEASLAASLLNPVGLDGTEALVGPKHPAFGGNVNELVHEEHFWAVKMTSERYQEADVRHGSMALGVMWPKVSAVTRWPAQGGWGLWDLWSMWEDFAEDGRIKGPTDAVPSENGRTDTATVCALVELEPGESLTVPFLLTWHFPNRVNDWNTEPEVRGKVIRNYYATWFKDAWAAMKFLVRDYERLQLSSRAFERSFWQSELPADVLESAGNQLATLRSTTCFRDEEGRLFGFEGSGKGYDDGSDRQGCCPMNCTHVWNYAQTTAFLFPELERGMREVDFRTNTRPGGSMAFRSLIPIASGTLWQMKPAADGQMGTVIRLYREWQMSGDRQFLERCWPNAKASLEFAWQAWDADRDGLMEGEQHNTYDIEFYGANPLTTIIYLGALRAGEEMAMAMGDAASAAEYRRVFESGARRTVDKLWGGEYFIQPGPEPARRGSQADTPAGEQPHQMTTGCLSDQLLGQWMAHVTGLGYLLPETHVRKAAAAVFRYNFKPDLRGVPNSARVYARAGEGGLLACTWPKGGRTKAPFPYADEVWTGIEYHVAATLIYEGLVAEGLAVVAAVRARHDGERRNPFNEPECGNHYARGLSSWSLLLALTGFRWSAPEATLRFVPAPRPGAGHRAGAAVPAKRVSAFFSNGLAWGTATEGWSGRKGLVSFRVEDGTLTVKRLLLSPSLTRLERCWIEPSQTFLRGAIERRKGETLIEFGSEVQIKPGQALILSCSR